MGVYPMEEKLNKGLKLSDMISIHPNLELVSRKVLLTIRMLHNYNGILSWSSDPLIPVTGSLEMEFLMHCHDVIEGNSV